MRKYILYRTAFTITWLKIPSRRSPYWPTYIYRLGKPYANIYILVCHAWTHIYRIAWMLYYNFYRYTMLATPICCHQHVLMMERPITTWLSQSGVCAFSTIFLLENGCSLRSKLALAHSTQYILCVIIFSSPIFAPFTQTICARSAMILLVYYIYV